MTEGFDPDEYTLFIFDRWGELIFESHNTNLGWDGSYNGKISPDGTYIWKIIVRETTTDNLQKFVGHVTLIR